MGAIEALAEASGCSVAEFGAAVSAVLTEDLGFEVVIIFGAPTDAGRTVEVKLPASRPDNACQMVQDALLTLMARLGAAPDRVHAMRLDRPAGSA